jgi:hypothetical protein
MMPRVCGQVRRQLSEFHDGELPVGEQIAVQAHLRGCPACAAEARELDDLGVCLRTGALSAAAEPGVWEGLPSTVVGRMKAEDAESISGRTGRFFEDLHVVWAALGATGATVASLVLISAICFYAVSSPVGYNKNPMVPAPGMSLPSASTSTTFPTAATIDEEGLVLLLDAVFTRDGDIAKLELIEDAAGGLRPATKEERRAVLALLDELSKARFQPARLSGSPVPVAVNMVWLYASLTVKGKMPELQLTPRPRGSTSNSNRVNPRASLLA